jgi:hypothetical protein
MTAADLVLFVRAEAGSAVRAAVVLAEADSAVGAVVVPGKVGLVV